MPCTRFEHHMPVLNAKCPFVHGKRSFLCVKRPFIFGNFCAVQHQKKCPPSVRIQEAVCTLGLRKCSGLSFCTVCYLLTQVRPYRSDLWYTLESSSGLSLQEKFLWTHPVGLEPARCTLRVLSDALPIARNQLSLQSNCDRDSHIARTCQTIQLHCYLNQRFSVGINSTCPS